MFPLDSLAWTLTVFLVQVMGKVDVTCTIRNEKRKQDRTPVQPLKMYNRCVQAVSDKGTELLKQLGFANYTGIAHVELDKTTNKFIKPDPTRIKAMRKFVEEQYKTKQKT